ncbi:helix-turn-helix domain-containing protein [Streptomyces xiamenensis]
MSTRRFDRVRLRSVRRAAEMSQAEMAAGVRVSDSTVAGWELGSSEPDQEKLPAIARVLRRDLDDLFPRGALPDLRDLRCDAGLYRYEMAEIIGTKSDGPVAGAEQGVRRLKVKYLPALARAYGVSEDELKEAEERSFARARGDDASDGVSAAETEELPRTLADKITLMLDHSYPAGTAPSDQDIAAAVNAYAGLDVISADGVARLRLGEDEDPAPVVRQGLAHMLGVTPLYFEADDVVARQVYEGLRLMSAAKQGQVGRIRARGMTSQGVPPDVLSILNDLATKLDKAERPESE